MTYFFAASGLDEHFFDEAIAGHARALRANYLMDITSSDPATVWNWFQDKLDFAPLAKDISTQGFSLVSGRLDYLYDRELAALIYQRGPTAITVFAG
ncbi:MAG: hypothetical protein IPK63_17145 [Candidatus Competibacteraceae bacterium]|nr:hypothetical protein [Candidatus Competibacteraceae bacterium]